MQTIYVLRQKLTPFNAKVRLVSNQTDLTPTLADLGSPQTGKRLNKDSFLLLKGEFATSLELVRPLLERQLGTPVHFVW